MSTKKIVVYHKNETMASRARRPRPGEQVFYKAAVDFDKKFNESMDEVIEFVQVPKSMRKKEKSDVA